jgi:hypothetical protein
LSRRLCLVVLAREEDRRRSGLLVAESEPDHDRFAGLADIPSRFLPGVLVLSYRLNATWPEAATARPRPGRLKILTEPEPLLVCLRKLLGMLMTGVPCSSAASFLAAAVEMTGRVRVDKAALQSHPRGPEDAGQHPSGSWVRA